MTENNQEYRVIYDNSLESCISKSETAISWSETLIPPSCSNSSSTIYYSLSSSKKSDEKIISDEKYDFSQLPKKLLIKIFSFLSEIEISRFVLRVCRKWYICGKDPILWRELRFAYDDVGVTEICRLLRSAPKLKTLSLICMSDVKTVIRQMCRCNKEIENLTIRKCTQSKILAENVLRNVLISCPKLQTLDLKGTKFHATKFYQELTLCPQIKSLNLSDNPYLSVQNILTIGLNCHHLEELKLTKRSQKKNENFNDDNMNVLFSNLAKTLKVIKFDCTDLQNAAIETILKCSNLQYICLLNAHGFSNLLFRNLWGYVPKLRKMKIIKAIQLSTNDFYHLFTEGGHYMKKLSVIDITGCWKLTDSGLESIAECCGPNLQKLSIKSCKSIRKIDSLMKFCPNLKYLNIAYCTNLDLDCLLHVPENLSELEKLIIDVSDENYMIIKTICSRYKINIWISLSEYNKENILFSLFNKDRTMFSTKM